MPGGGGGGRGLGPGREFDRIRSLLAGVSADPDSRVRLGPGDDCALVEPGPMAVSTDLSVEGVHFRREWLSVAEIGDRTVTAALSDLAAMAATPLGVLVSVATPQDEPEATLTELAEGFRRACHRTGAAYLGGDLAAGSEGLVLDVAVLGLATEPVLRSGAVPGDGVWVTGVLGGSAGAVRAWNEGSTPDPALRDAFAGPRARVDEALWLRSRAGLTSLIDLSDGIGRDAAHLAAASGVRIELDAPGLPVHPGLVPAWGVALARELALGGGEDYELCFTAPDTAVEAVASAFRERFGLALTRVGNVEAGSGVYLRAHSGAEARPLDPSVGFDHFAQGSPDR